MAYFIRVDAETEVAYELIAEPIQEPQAYELIAELILVFHVYLCNCAFMSIGIV